MSSEFTPPPQKEPLEFKELPVSTGTMADDLPPPRSGGGLRTVLVILAVVMALGLAGVAALVYFGASKVQTFFQETGSRTMVEVRRAEEELTEDEDAPRTPKPLTIAATFAPSGETVPGMVYIDSIPDGAQVRIGDELVGETPLMLGRPFEGTVVQVTVTKKGYHPWTGQVQVVGGGIRADITLKPRR